MITTNKRSLISPPYQHSILSMSCFCPQARLFFKQIISAHIFFLLPGCFSTSLQKTYLPSKNYLMQVFLISKKCPLNIHSNLHGNYFCCYLFPPPPSVSPENMLLRTSTTFHSSCMSHRFSMQKGMSKYSLNLKNAINCLCCSKNNTFTLFLK